MCKRNDAVENAKKQPNTAPGCTTSSCAAPVTQIKTGGVSGQVLDVTYEVDDSDCDSLQAIQVVWANGGPMQVGNMQVKKGTDTYDAFVDGGKNSPYVTVTGNPPAHPSNPYY